MQQSRNDVLQAALQLSQADRSLLASDLLATLPVDLPGMSLQDPEFLDELRRRSTDESPKEDWETVRNELHRNLNP